MENKPNFKIIGNITPEEKQKEEEILSGLLSEKHLSTISESRRDLLKKLELKKTPEQSALINFANDKTSELMRRVGIKPYGVPENNIHIVPKSLYEKIHNDYANAVTFSAHQAIFLNADKVNNNLKFGRIVFHELLHIKGFLKMEVNKNDTGGFVKTSYREGVGMQAPQKHGLSGNYYEYNRGLHEAIVSSCEPEYINQMTELPMFTEQEQKPKIDEPNYANFREVYDYVVNEIYSDNKDRFPSVEDVKDIFLKSHFDGNLTPIVRLVEKTFGHGSFRILGMMDNRRNSIQVMKSLRSIRMQTRGDLNSSRWLKKSIL